MKSGDIAGSAHSSLPSLRLDMSAAPAPVLGKHKLEGASDDGQSENKQIKR